MSEIGEDASSHEVGRLMAYAEESDDCRETVSPCTVIFLHINILDKLMRHLEV